MKTRRPISVVLALVVLATGLITAVPAGAQSTWAPTSWYPDHVVDDRAPVNGCGSQGDDGIDVPDVWFGVSFTEACNWHDKCYGTKGLTQGYCDQGMWFKTMSACAGNPNCISMANVYYLGVAIAGGKPYREGQQEACEREPRRDGRVYGDPHIRTLDGVSYAFQAAGEFSIMRDAEGADLIQGRFHPEGDQFTVVSGVAVRLGEREVVVQFAPDGAVQIYVDDELITRDMAAFDEGMVEANVGVVGTRQVVGIRGWDGLQVEAVIFPGSRMDLSVHVPQDMWGRVSGLMGNADGDAENDIVDGNGRVLPVTSSERYVYADDFKEEYRITVDESMFVAVDGGFDYHADRLRDYPLEVVTLDSFSDAEIDQARNLCGRTGLEDEQLESCIWDVLVSGDESYAEQSARSASRARDIAHPHGDGSRDHLHGDDAELILVPRPPLVEAAERGDLAEVRRLLDGGADPDVGRESDGLTPLISALILQHPAIVELLLARGANPNAFEERHMAPLQFAIIAGQRDMVTALLEAGANPNTGSDQGAGGMSPLSAAAAVGDLDLAELLLDHGADIDGGDLGAGEMTPLAVAAGSGKPEMLSFLLSRGADPNGQVDNDRAGPAPLWAAVLANDVSMVRLLLDAGARPEIAFPNGGMAQMTNNQQILDLLTR